MRWGQQGEQGPNHIGSMKTAIMSLHFILNVVTKSSDFLKDNSCYCVKIGYQQAYGVRWSEKTHSELYFKKMKCVSSM